MPDNRTLEARQIARDLATLAYDLASERMNMIFRRYGVDTKLFNPNQPRVHAGQRAGGQWTKSPTATSAKRSAASLGARALGALVSNPEAAAAAGAAVLPMLAGGVGLSRAAGLNAVSSGSASGMTPILGIPYNVPLTMTNSPYGRSEDQQGKIDEECEEQFQKDIVTCQLNAAMYGKKTMYSSNQIFSICMAQAIKRNSQCRLDGGVGNITIPLFDGRKIK